MFSKHAPEFRTFESRRSIWETTRLLSKFLNFWLDLRPGPLFVKENCTPLQIFDLLFFFKIACHFWVRLESAKVCQVQKFVRTPSLNDFLTIFRMDGQKS